MQSIFTANFQNEAPLPLERPNVIPLGEARLTHAGDLPFRGIIHVAGINMLWYATHYSVTQSVKNALALAEAHQFESIAFPLIGSGSGQRGQQWSLDLIAKTLTELETSLRVVVVQYDS